jgi:hypothetical protein
VARRSGPVHTEQLSLGEDNTLELEEAHAREETAGAALTRLDGLASASWSHGEHIDRLRAIYTQRLRRASPINLGYGDASAQAQAALRRLRATMSKRCVADSAICAGAAAPDA